MSYVNYTDELQRQGWRPVGETNPFSATHLGAVPFRPETLRGNASTFSPGVHVPFDGQHSDKPFSFSGGQVLHGGWRSDGRHDPRGRRGASPRVRARGMAGLGAMVPDQSVLTYQGTWSIPTFSQGVSAALTPASDYLNQVVTALGSDGLLVRNSSSSGGWVSPTFAVTIQLQVNNGQGFADPNDVIAIIRHEVYVATGQFPSADSIPTIQTPDPTQPGGLAAPVGTGQPTVAGAPPPPPPGGTSSFTAWLEQNAMWIGLGVAAVVFVPVLMEKI